MTRPSSLDQWLAFIDTGHSQLIDLGLERIRKVAALIDAGRIDCPVITVGGTNGKGSTIAFMAEMLTSAGYRVGRYTSPHFLRYNERVVIGDRPVDDQSLCEAFTRVEAAREQAGVSLTYFEYGTLAALDLFRQAALDVVLLEVGLGGRLDAVNIVDPDISVVTTVALDHESWLGTNREQIGFEKAGIFRADRPAVYGEPDIPASVSDHAASLGAPIFISGQAFGADQQSASHWSWFGVDRLGKESRIEGLTYPALPFENASTAIQALKLLCLDIPDSSFRQGVVNARLTGRFQQLAWKNRRVILDVAHNPHAAVHLAEQLVNEQARVHCVLGMLEDKDIANTLNALSRCVDVWYPASLDVPRGQTGAALQQQLNNVQPGLSGVSYPSAADAFDRAVSASEQGDVILVAGSFFTVAQVLQTLGVG